VRDNQIKTHLPGEGRQVVGTREAKKLVTRRSMVDAAARLFAERGVDGTTMDDIARAAGTSRTSVFNYFGYKEMILCEIGARYVEELAGSMLSVARRSARQRLIDLADLVAELANREPELISPIVREMTHPDPERRRQASETMQYRRVVESSLDMLEATGRLRSPRARRSYARMIVDMVAGAVIRAGDEFPRAGLRDELRRCVEVLLDGTLAPA
jgi:AcrR family transcriptional regulator